MCYTARMPDYAQTMADQTPVSTEDQKKMGQAKSGKMGDEHNEFLNAILAMLDKGEIDAYVPQSLLNKAVYNSLNDEWKGKTDLTLVNIATQLQNIVIFRQSKHTPDEAPILEQMIEELWQMKQRIEDHYDVFKI